LVEAFTLVMDMSSSTHLYHMLKSTYTKLWHPIPGKYLSNFLLPQGKGT